MRRVVTVSESLIRRVVQHLASCGVIIEVRRAGTDNTIIGDVPSAQEDVFRLAKDVRGELALFAQGSERERSSQREWPRSRGAEDGSSVVIGRARSLSGIVN